MKSHAINCSFKVYFEDLPQFRICSQCSWSFQQNFRLLSQYNSYSIFQGDFEFKYPIFVSKQFSLSRLRQWLFTPSNSQMAFSNDMNPKPTEFFAQNTYGILLFCDKKIDPIWKVLKQKPHKNMFL